MASFRFLHCSDLHIDSPFKGLAHLPDALAERLKDAPSRAWDNIVRLAIKEKVDAVIVAGDVYDGADRSLQAQLKFRRGLEALDRAGIPSFVAHGNHDPLDGWAHALDWPKSVTIFPGDDVKAMPVEKNGNRVATIYGISYPTREVRHNLAPKFTRQTSGGFHIAVLHANVGGHPDHDPYAPASVADLSKQGMDYWALGHIHKREILNPKHPAIVYPGNPQGRHLKESGAKGCVLVTLTKDQAPDIRFAETDVARYHTMELDVSELESVDAVMNALEAEVGNCIGTNKNLDHIARVKLTGRTPLHHELKKSGALSAVQEEVQDRFSGQGLWLTLLSEIKGAYDLDSLSQGQDFTADLLTLYASEEGVAVEKTLATLFEDWQGRGFLETLTEEETVLLKQKARDLTLDLLSDPEN